MVEQIAGVQFERVECGDFNGVPIVRTLRLRDEMHRFKEVLSRKAGALLDYLEDTDQQALWVIGLEDDMYGVGREACEVLPNNKWTFNMVSHVHQASSLDLLSSRKSTPNRAPFQVFSEQLCREFIRSNREVLSSFVEGWSHAHLHDKFVGDLNRGVLESMMFTAHVEVALHKLSRGDSFPSGLIAQEDIAKWTSLLSTFFAASQVYRGGEALKEAELNWKPDGVIPWAQHREPSCVIFRGMHRGSAQVDPSVWGSATIQNAVLFGSRGFVSGW